MLRTPRALFQRLFVAKGGGGRTTETAMEARAPTGGPPVIVEDQARHKQWPDGPGPVKTYVGLVAATVTGVCVTSRSTCSLLTGNVTEDYLPPMAQMN